MKPLVVSAPVINNVSFDTHLMSTPLLLPRIVFSRSPIALVSEVSIIRTPYEGEVVAPQSVIVVIA